ncbi:MAG: mechanosensitive ion channel domain-containing protein [Pseudohongiellaceae bacterium]
MDIEALRANIGQFLDTAINWSRSPELYAEFGIILLAVILAYSFAVLLKKYSPMLRREPATGVWLPLKRGIYNISDLLFPLFTIPALGIAVEISEFMLSQSWLARICQSLAVVFALYSIVTRFVSNVFIKIIFKWFIIPIAILAIFDVLIPIIAYLDALDIQIGNIRLSAYGLARVIIFGSILLWLGILLNNMGQQLIRKQETINLEIREIFAQLFQVTLFIVIAILLLQILGVNLTALAVFGGALGVGLGFGLQAIASNFISGLIILLDRSIKVGDYIELEDGLAGTIRDINMRSTLMETFDGKDVMVPNEQFISTRFVNWTHKHKKQRYDIHFQVAYKTDIPKMLEIVKKTVRSHPQVINKPDTPIEELADAEIASFGESGIEILVEFWMEGIDDGVNRVGADLLLMIWQALKDNDIEIPFPQRDVHLVNQGGA